MQNATTVYQVSRSTSIQEQTLTLQQTISLTLTLKLFSKSEWKVFMAAITEKLAIYIFPLTQCTVVLLFCIQYSASYANPKLIPVSDMAASKIQPTFSKNRKDREKFLILSVGFIRIQFSAHGGQLYNRISLESSLNLFI